MTSRPSRKRARDVAGFSWAALDQYSIPVPSGKPNSMRPPDMTSSIAYSSATRLGHDRLIGTPATMSLTRLSLQAVIIRSASSTLTPMGFSHRTWTPARAARSV